MSRHLNIIVPVYNEGANFASLWAELCSHLKLDFTAYAVFDFDDDDTLPVVRRLVEEGETRLRLIKNRIRPGVVGAILTGFGEVRRGPALVVMADLSDDLAKVNEMLELFSRGYHIVVGSRYMRGGRIEDGPLLKQFLSRLAGLTLHWLRGVPTHDATNAFKIYDAEMVRSFDLQSRHGFELNLEITVKAFLAGYRITEVPCTWRDRTAGKSRFRLWRWLPHYLRWYFYAFQPRRALRAVPMAVPGTERDRTR